MTNSCELVQENNMHGNKYKLIIEKAKKKKLRRKKSKSTHIHSLLSSSLYNLHVLSLKKAIVLKKQNHDHKIKLNFPELN